MTGFYYTLIVLCLVIQRFKACFEGFSWPATHGCIINGKASHGFNGYGQAHHGLAKVPVTVQHAH